MDKNTWIGFGLIAVIIIGFSFLNRPSKEEQAAQQRTQVMQTAEVIAEQESAKVTNEQAAQSANTPIYHLT